MVLTDGNSKRGLLIVFEGLAGSGKTTQSKRLVSRIEREGKRVLWNCEPTRGFFGSLVRGIINGESPELFLPDIKRMYQTLPRLAKIYSEIGLDIIFNKVRRGEALTELERQTLFMCDRLYDITHTITPAIANATHVVQDRYDMSTFTHGIAEGISFPKLSDLAQRIMGKLYMAPDILVFIDVPWEMALSRLSARGDISMYDTPLKMKAIYDAYRKTLALEMHAKVPDALCVVSGEGSPDEIEAMVFGRVRKSGLV